VAQEVAALRVQVGRAVRAVAEGATAGHLRQMTTEARQSAKNKLKKKLLAHHGIGLMGLRSWVAAVTSETKARNSGE
jgi:hypothetical protein